MSLSNQIKIIERRLINDDRGWFLKAITGTEENIPVVTGEVYLTMAKSGQAKGGHYHPKAIEWFTLIQGKATLLLEDVVTHEKMQLKLSFDSPQTIFVPNNVAHIFINEHEEDFILLAYTDQIYDPKDTVNYLL